MQSAVNLTATPRSGPLNLWSRMRLLPHSANLPLCPPAAFQGMDRPSMESAINSCAQEAGLDPVELHVCATGAPHGQTIMHNQLSHCAVQNDGSGRF